MKNIEHFLGQFGISSFDKGRNVIFVESDKFFLVSPEMNEIVSKGQRPFYAGLYIGKQKGEKFFPSLNLLNLIKPKTNNKIMVNEKTEWLFLCGRDIFGGGVVKAGSAAKGKIVLVLGKNEEVLGFGKVINDLNAKGVVVQNILDAGDFLRRERKGRKKR